ncbi:hypothetical protein [Capnocytophaga canimorsus]|uniref:hypothetical protein n=1 Tax=Capnocytophaga canimorsus TaxID=28188 RepID=UPI0015628777|nr:hypothetical protein [Capnocytophaga canimorsus]
MALSINQKLESGWSPFYEDSNNRYKSIAYCFDTYLKNIEKEKEDGVIRPNTFRSYTSLVKNIKNFLEEKYPSLKFIIEVDRLFILINRDCKSISRAIIFISRITPVVTLFLSKK